MVVNEFVYYTLTRSLIQLRKGWAEGKAAMINSEQKKYFDLQFLFISP